MARGCLLPYITLHAPVNSSQVAEVRQKVAAGVAQLWDTQRAAQEAASERDRATRRIGIDDAFFRQFGTSHR